MIYEAYAVDADTALHCETKPVIYLRCRDVADPVELLAWPGFYSHMTIGGQDAVSGAWRHGRQQGGQGGAGGGRILPPPPGI